MLALGLGMLLVLQQPPCLPPAMELMAQASVRASRFDVGAALELLRAATDCSTASVAAVYVQGLIDARRAAEDGGTAESLEPVRRAIAVLDVLGRGRPGQVEVARQVLQAAAAAAQTERDEMRVYLESALRLERLQTEAGEPGAPIVSAAEMAGVLWLQVHRYEEARLAYDEARQRLGPTAPVLVGSAKAAARLGDEVSACGHYRALLDAWGQVQEDPGEIVEARAYLARPGCQGSAP